MQITNVNYYFCVVFAASCVRRPQQRGRKIAASASRGAESFMKTKLIFCLFEWNGTARCFDPWIFDEARVRLEERLSVNCFWSIRYYRSQRNVFFTNAIEEAEARSSLSASTCYALNFRTNNHSSSQMQSIINYLCFTRPVISIRDLLRYPVHRYVRLYKIHHIIPLFKTATIIQSSLIFAPFNRHVRSNVLIVFLCERNNFSHGPSIFIAADSTLSLWESTLKFSLEAYFLHLLKLLKLTLKVIRHYDQKL